MFYATSFGALDDELHSVGNKVVKRGSKSQHTDVKPQMAVERPVPILDENTFQQILEAAYVLQQQNDLKSDLKKAPRPIDPATTLAQIAETQELLRSQALELKSAARLISERLRTITNASGVAIAVIRGDQLEYCAATGADLRLEGSKGTIDTALSDFLNDKETVRRFQSKQWSRDMVESHNPDHPLLFPIYHEGRISGLLQLSFAESESIQEHEIQSCQVMAGLMGEAIARANEVEWKRALAAERATMLDALERLRPQLERLVEPGSEPEPAQPEELTMPDIPALREANKQAEEVPDLNIRESPVCQQCGYQFGEGEMFCGRCGTPRTLDFSEWTDAELKTQTELEFESGPGVAALEETESSHPTHDAFADLIANPELFAEKASAESIADRETSEETALTIHKAEPAEESAADQPEEEAKPELVVVPKKPEAVSPTPFSSASGALRWLRSLERENSASREWLDTHRGDIAIGVATLVLIVALSGWGSHPVQSHSKLPPAPRLTLFERMLVGLGLAEPPPTPDYSGNPNVQVWEDVHTALYYCPGSELYGKTPDGKFTTQGDAQLDQFQPAARKICE